MRRLLAQRIVDEFRFDPKLFKPEPILQRCLEGLGVPWEGGNHFVLPHRALGPIYAAEAEQKSAAIYHFDEDAFAASEAIVGNSAKRLAMVRKLARSPGPRCFFEFRYPSQQLRDVGVGTFGLYVEGDRDMASCLLWVEMNGTPAPTMYCQFSLNSIGEGRCRAFTDMLNRKAWTNKTQSHPKDFEPTLDMLCCFWAFLASTGAVVVDRVPAPRGTNKIKIRGSGAAILSFNRVRLALPKGCIIRDEHVTWERGEGVRRHQVRAHPSWYHVGSRHEGAMLLRWIAAYWRGNARLGLVLKARDVALNEGRPAQ